MRECKELQKQAGEYGVISGERWKIYMFGHHSPTRFLLEQFQYYDVIYLVG
jgi:hypothetical protein